MVAHTKACSVLNLAMLSKFIQVSGANCLHPYRTFYSHSRHCRGGEQTTLCEATAFSDPNDSIPKSRCSCLTIENRLKLSEIFDVFRCQWLRGTRRLCSFLSSDDRHRGEGSITTLCVGVFRLSLPLYKTYALSVSLSLSLFYNSSQHPL